MDGKAGSRECSKKVGLDRGARLLRNRRASAKEESNCVSKPSLGSSVTSVPEFDGANAGYSGHLTPTEENRFRGKGSVSRTAY